MTDDDMFEWIDDCPEDPCPNEMGDDLIESAPKDLRSWPDVLCGTSVDVVICPPAILGPVISSINRMVCEYPYKKYETEIIVHNGAKNWPEDAIKRGMEMGIKMIVVIPTSRYDHELVKDDLFTLASVGMSVMITHQANIIVNLRVDEDSDSSCHYRVLKRRWETPLFGDLPL